MDFMEAAVSIYVLWAVFAGCEFMNGRVQFLERDGIGYKVLKFLCVLVVGSVYGMIYLVVLLLKFMGIMEREF